jgi:hypothetical protein
VKIVDHVGLGLSPGVLAESPDPRNAISEAAGIIVKPTAHFENKILTIDVPGVPGRILLSALVLAFLYIPIHRAWAIITANRLVLKEATAENLSRAIRYDPSNSELWWLHGRSRHYSIDPVDIPGAINDYSQALHLNPRNGQAWLDLADCYERIRESDKAEKALQNALRVWTYSPQIRWQAGNFYLMRGNLDKMYECFKMASEYDLGKLGIAIQMAWKADPDHKAIYGKLIPDQLPHRLAYFDFLVSQDELDLARTAWEGSLASPVPASFVFKVSIVFFYLDRLLAQNRVEDALQAWREALRKSGSDLTDNRVDMAGAHAQPGLGENLVWNGSFENEILRGGWDWRFPDSQEFELRTDLEDPMDELRSLRLSFAGTNINLSHLSQIVPTPVPGAYQLEFYAKTNGLTTDRRPFIMVQGFPNPQSADARTDMFPESSSWKKYSVQFTVKAGGKAVRLLLRRELSQKLDSKMKGMLWLDKFSVRRLDASVSR